MGNSATYLHQQEGPGKALPLDLQAVNPRRLSKQSLAILSTPQLPDNTDQTRSVQQS
jgi:hypothetical protein